MGFLLALIFIFFVLPYLMRPLLIWWLKRRVQSKFDEVFKGFTPQSEPQPRQRKGGWSAPMARKKKIEKGEGEYVKFEEVSIEVSKTNIAGDGKSDEKIVVEQQIVDIEWEDI